MIILINKEKNDKIQHPFMTNTLNKVWPEGTYLNIIEDTYDKSTSNIMLNSKNTEDFLLRSRQGCPISQLSFNMALGSLARQEKGIKTT